jgi:hypothetical protein
LLSGRGFHIRAFAVESAICRFFVIFDQAPQVALDPEEHSVKVGVRSSKPTTTNELGTKARKMGDAGMGTKRSIAQACLSGMGGFFMVTRSPKFDLFRVQDILLLMISGACFGVAAASLYRLLMNKIEAPATPPVPKLPS